MERAEKKIHMQLKHFVKKLLSFYHFPFFIIHLTRNKIKCKHAHIFFFYYIFTHTPYNYMFTSHKNSKFNNNLKHTLKNQKFTKWSFQRLETDWRDCWELRNHTRRFWDRQNSGDTSAS